MLVHHTSARRKACYTCVQAKRRCDLRLPQCSRCGKRGAACIYATPPEASKDVRRPSKTKPLTITSSHINIQPTDNSLPTWLQTGDGFVIDLSADYVFPHLDSFPFPERTVISQEQIDFCIGQFKALIPDLVQQKPSPFIHHESYQRMPPATYQDILGICAMYIQKSPRNQTVIFAMLDSRVSNLINDSKSSPWLAKDYLIAVQAMTMYQIIRLFDGDIRQRGNAERHLEILQSWTFQLIPTNDIYTNNCNSESPYERWVFIESTRRTALMSTMVQAMYSLTKDGYCTSIPFLATLPLSIDGALWNSSEESWWQSTFGLGGDLVTYGDFVNKWRDGQALYTDTFETILIAACRHNLRRPPLMEVMAA